MTLARALLCSAAVVLLALPAFANTGAHAATAGHGGTTEVAATGAHNTTSEAHSPAHSSVHGVHHDVSSLCDDPMPSCRLQHIPECTSEHCHHMIVPLIFPFFALFIGCILQGLTKLLRLPYTLLLLFSGVLLGLLGCAADLGLLTISLQQWAHLSPPDIFFFIFLAPLIFEAAFNTEWHIFKRLMLPIFTAAFAIVLAQTFAIAGFTKGVAQGQGWDIWSALMFGAMLSATDPISVTATLKALGASENLGTLIEGESLVNDGSAFVLWEAFFDNARHATDPTRATHPPGEIFQLVLQKSIGGALLGALFALIALAILSMVHDEFEVETSLTVVVAFLGFWTAQSPAKLSGVICNVASGLMLSAYGRPLISKTVRHALAEFWELLGWIANTIVFVHSGMLTVAFIWPCSSRHFTPGDYFLVFAFFIFLQLLRVMLFGAAHPLLAWRNKWFTWKENLVVGLSGLRGAVSLILALNVAGARAIHANVRSRIVLWSTGIVFLSLIVNGLFIPVLMKWLKLDGPDKTRAGFLRRARAAMTQATLVTLDILCVDVGYKTARWSYVLANVMPSAWLEDDNDGLDYAMAAEDIRDNVPNGRTSLQFVRNEAHRDPEHGGRHSTEIIHNEKMNNEPNRMSLSKPHNTKAWKARRESQRKRRMSEYSEANEHVSLWDCTAVAVDRERYYSMVEGPRPPTGDDDDTSTDYAFSVADEVSDFSATDQEVRRRMLTGMLAHVRALSNATLIEYSALVRLEEEIQSALDANEEGIADYDFFSRLIREPVSTRLLSKCINPKKFTGESIARASALFAILTKILKKDTLSHSRNVQTEAQQLHDAAASRLTELEMLNPKAFRWVQSQLAIHMTVARQDAVLHDLKASGVIDCFEHKVLHGDLLSLRRRHAVHARATWKKQNLRPKKLLPFHPMFADNPVAAAEARAMPVVNLQPGLHVGSGRGALLVVLQGALRPTLTAAARSPQRQSTQSSAWTHGRDSFSATTVPEKAVAAGIAPPTAQPHNWSFPAFSALCAGDMACAVNNQWRGKPCAVASERIQPLDLMADDIASNTTVLSMAPHAVRRLASESRPFRDEISRSLARQLVLDSVADQQTHRLRLVDEALGNSLDVHSVIGRAFRILERLPYMSVVRLHAGHKGSRKRGGVGLVANVQGPGVLINGVVRVSIEDTSGLEGAKNLLHERLEGPALLPAGGLIIEEVLVPGETSSSESSSEDDPDNAFEKSLGPVLAHILVEENMGLDASAMARLRRWKAHPNTIDMNSRFAMVRHFGLPEDCEVERDMDYMDDPANDLSSV